MINISQEILRYSVLFRETLDQHLLCMDWSGGANYIQNLGLFLLVLHVAYCCNIVPLKNAGVIYYGRVSGLKAVLVTYC